MRRITKDNSDVGKLCQIRRMQTLVTQKDVAVETGYTYQTVSAFERGKLRSMDLLIWYMLNMGVTVEDLRRCTRSE